MSRFYHDFTSELTPDETKRLSDLCDMMFRQFVWEREQPAHICEQSHAGKLTETKEKSEDGKTLVSRSHELTPVCHDCNRGLIRPEGGESDTWICPAVHRLPLRALKTDQAVECGKLLG